MDRIEHLVILMMENRSFDHYLGSLSLEPEGRGDIDGLRVPLTSLKDTNGRDIVAWAMDSVANTPNPPHGWGAAHAAYNDGHNDGFVVQFQKMYPMTDSRIPMGYYTRKTLPVLYQLADQFTVCDHWFASVLSSTWPNKKHLHSGRRDADNDTQLVPPFPGFKTTPIYDVLEDTLDVSGKGLTWKCYFSDIPFLALWYMFAIRHVHHFTHVERVSVRLPRRD